MKPLEPTTFGLLLVALMLFGPMLTIRFCWLLTIVLAEYMARRRTSRARL